MKHTEHISKYCNEEEILDTLERLGKYLYDLDEELIRLKDRRENSPTWKEAICDDYLNEYRKSIRPGPPWHQKIWDLILDLRTRERHKKIGELCANLGKRIGARKQALSAIYPPGGYVGWHTNADVPGRNLLFTWSQKGEGVLRYKNHTKGFSFDIPDHKGWNVKSFDWFSHGQSEKEGYTWDVIVNAFLSKDLTEEDALLNARLARILTKDDYDNGPIPWSPSNAEG